MTELLNPEDVMKRYKLSSRKTVYNWINNGALPPPIKMGGNLYWRRSDLEAREARLAGAAAKPEVEPPIVTQVDCAPLAVAAARHFAKHGAFPKGHREDWRTDFRYATGRPPADLLQAFGLPANADFSDIADRIERRFNPQPKMPAYPGWSEGKTELVARAERAERVSAELRKEVRR